MEQVLPIEVGSPQRVPAAPGRAAGLALLSQIRPAAYAATRNFLDGAVSRLSPYLRHGILSLVEVRDAALSRTTAQRAYKFVQELSWREYYQRVYRVLGDAIWEDVEPYKTGFRADEYARELPADIENGETGLACIDGFTHELRGSGSMHNHARMWFASYVVHFRRVRWQAGARFFLRELLDGDAASNNLSWQWIASTFSQRPYSFNRANLEYYTNGAYCRTCPLEESGCPFDATYAVLDERIFPNGRKAVEERDVPSLEAPPDRVAPPIPKAGVVVWHHDESLSRTDPARAAAPDAPAIFVWDGKARQRDPWSLARTRFVERTLDDLGLNEIAHGDAASELLRFAAEHGANTVVTTEPVDPRLRDIVSELAFTLRVLEVPPQRVAPLDKTTSLRRFSRYWARAERSAFGSEIVHKR